MYSYAVHIVSPELLLVAKPHEFSLFVIPQLASLDDQGNPCVVPVQAIWTHKQPGQHDQVLGRPHVRPMPASELHMRGKVAVLTGSSIFILSLSERQGECHAFRHIVAPDARYVPALARMGSRYAFWPAGNLAGPFINLHTCAYFTMPDECSVLHRLGHVEQTTIQCRPLNLPVQHGEVIDLSWDEESARLCILVSRQHRNEHTHHVLLVHMA